MGIFDSAWCPGCDAKMEKIGSGARTWRCPKGCGVFSANGSRTGN
jgi:hypothetical protein